MCIHNAIQHNSVTGEDIVLNTFEKDGVYDQRQQILAGLGTKFPASASYVMRNDLIKACLLFRKTTCSRLSGSSISGIKG